MSRELVLGGLTFSLCGLCLVLCGLIPSPSAEDGNSNGLDLERRTWRRLWFPLIPAFAVVAILIGWAWQEPPETDELLTWRVTILVLPFLFVVVRASRRAVASLRTAEPIGPAATVGILRPRVVIDDCLSEALDPEALDAAWAHERAHARHFDPLRIWLAQLVTDLQWPSPGARGRFQEWRNALELARDEEARLSGVAGEDLAAAIVTTIRLPQAAAARGGAGLTSAHETLTFRIRRLLRPIPPRGTGLSTPLLLVSIAVVMFALSVCGVRFGDELLRALPFISVSGPAG